MNYFELPIIFYLLANIPEIVYWCSYFYNSFNLRGNLYSICMYLAWQGWEETFVNFLQH